METETGQHCSFQIKFFPLLSLEKRNDLLVGPNVSDWPRSGKPFHRISEQPERSQSRAQLSGRKVLGFCLIGDGKSLKLLIQSHMIKNAL